MAKVYTRIGDKGETSLVSGTRTEKSSDRIKLYGEVDELNSVIGLLISHLNNDIDKFGDQLDILRQVQNNLFNLGSRLACESGQWEKYKLPELHSSLTSILEEGIDKMDNELDYLTSFILPGGAIAASQAHVSRCVCRRVERFLVGFSQLDQLPGNSIQFINRLSDYLFVLARFINKKMDKNEEYWKN